MSKALLRMSTKVIQKGVILAAGRGSRIFPLSLNYPKPLFPIADKPIMQYQIEAMAKEGISEIVVVLGHKGDKIQSFFGDGSKLGVALTYVWDKKPLGIANSLLKAKSLFYEPFVLFLGDIFISGINLRSSIKLFEDKKPDGVIIARHEKDTAFLKRNFSIVQNSEGQILKVVEKPKKAVNHLKGLGVYIFTPAIFWAIKKTPRSALRGEVELTDSIQTLIDAGREVYCDIWDCWDFNITYPQDIIECSLRFLQSSRQR